MTAGAGQYSGVLVLFDWNGTLVLDRDRARRALNDVLAARGLPTVPTEHFGATFKLPMSTMFADLGVAPSDARSAEREWNAGIARVGAPVRPGTLATLTALAEGGARIGVVSAASARAIDADVVRLGFGAMFGSVDAAVVDKERTLRERRAGFEFACYVGDTTYDMRSAVRAGFLPVGARRGYAEAAELRGAGAAVVIDDLRELLAIVDRRTGLG